MTKNNGIEMYGVLLGVEEMDKFSETYQKEKGIDDFEQYEVADYFEIEFETNFTGDAFKVNELGQDKYEKVDNLFFLNDEIYLCMLKEQPTLLHGGYTSLEEAAEEIKKGYADILGEDFDFRGNIYHIIGTYYG